MLKIFLARHGETIWNTQSRMQGRLDSPLTNLGLSQARSLAGTLKAIRLDWLWTSPALRAVKTAEIIRDVQSGDIRLLIDERIHEMDLGRLEGLTVGEAEAIDPVNLKSFFFEPHLFIPLGGESFADVSARVAEFLADLTRLARQCQLEEIQRHALIISHNITLKALFALMENRPLAMLRDGPPIRQAALYSAHLEDKWLLREISENRNL